MYKSLENYWPLSGMLPVGTRVVILVSLVFSSAGCHRQSNLSPADVETRPSDPQPSGDLPGPLAPSISLPEQSLRVPAGGDYTVLGSGPSVPVPPHTKRPPPAASTDGVRLQFVAADIKDVARAILGDMLHLNYVVDPQVQGQLTVATDESVPRSAVLPIFETALRDAGFALVRGSNRLWHITPLATAARSTGLSASGEEGYSARVIALRWVAAAELARTLTPILPNGASLRPDETRNTITVSGPSVDLDDIVANVEALDVDSLHGQSFSLVQLHHSQAKAIAAELPKLLGEASGLTKIFSLDRLNAVFVASVQPTYVVRARNWIERLDQGSGGTERRIYVYRVQYGRAAEIASVLGKLLGVTGSSSSAGGGGKSSLGGDRPTAGSVDAQLSQTAGQPLLGQPSDDTSQGASSLPDVLRGPIPGSFGGSGPEAGAGESAIKINADETNNALLVVSTPGEWETIQSALVQLDVRPLQVLIDASIAEVSLTGQLQYGLQYFFRSGSFKLSNIENGTNVVSPTYPGFNLVYSGAGGASVILDLMHQLTKVHMLASPNLLVLNNQKARLQVGDQVPITTSSAVSTISSGAPVVNSIEYRDTGVILEITPRVNASGSVQLDISQEVSGVSSTTSSNLNSPTIQQRRISSSVSVEDNQTIALGGLIQDNRSDSRSGIPWLEDLPYAGPFFSVRTKSTTRTELVVLITPHIVRNRRSADAVTAEFRSKLPLLSPTAEAATGGVPP